MADEGCWGAWFDGLADSLRARCAPVERPPIPRAELIPPMPDERHEIVPRPFWYAGNSDVDEYGIPEPTGSQPGLPRSARRLAVKVRAPQGDTAG